MKPDIEVGDRVTDKITGFSGIVTSTNIWITGVTKCSVQPEKLHEGKTIPPESFDFEELEINDKRVITPTPIQYKGDIELGDTAKDKITGFQGIVYNRRVSISGCVEFGISPPILDKEGNPAKSWLIEASNVILVKKQQGKEKIPVGAGTGPARPAKSAR